LPAFWDMLYLTLQGAQDRKNEIALSHIARLAISTLKMESEVIPDNVLVCARLMHGILIIYIII
jgi:hypothetical protein